MSLPSPTTAAMTTTVAAAAMASTTAVTTATVTAIRMAVTLAAAPALMTVVLTFMAAPFAAMIDATYVIWNDVAVAAEAPGIIDGWTLLIAAAANAAR